MKRVMLASLLFLLLFSSQAPAPKKAPPQKPTPPKTPAVPKVDFPGLREKAGGPKKQSPKNQLQGVWRVRRLYSNSPRGTRINGYIVFTARHASFHLTLRQPQGEPLFQSGFWSYTTFSNQIHFQSLLGITSQEGGRVKPDTRRQQITRKFQFIGHTLRLYRAGNTFMEMDRLE